MDKKTLIISMDNIFATPYIGKYLNNMNTDLIDIIFWNRKNVNEEKLSVNKVYEYKNSSNNKIINYLGFYNFIKNIISSNKYKKLILLHSPLNILLTKELFKFKNRYIIDIRDFTFEKYKLYYLIQKFNIKRSFNTVISSPGYKNFLPKYEYSISHNTYNGNINEDFKFSRRPIIITQVGIIRFIEECNKLIHLLEDEKDFRLKFIGSGANNLKNCTKTNNVYLEDYFESSKTLHKYKDATIINNCYGNNNTNVKYALSNKLYISCMIKRPILVSSSTYLADVVEKYGLGISVDLNKDEVSKKIKSYVDNLDLEVFNKNCDKFLEQINKDETNFLKMLKGFESI